MTVTEYFAENVDEASEFYVFKSEKNRDAFVRRNYNESWKFGRIVDGVEITDGWK
jgi:hypothetical protein